MAHLIEVKDAYKIYNPGENEVHALDGVSLTVDRGEFLMIVGHSGSGKSTLMNMLGLLDICTSGEYLIDGKDVSNLSDDELSEIRNKEIGFIFQGFNLIPSLTAKGNVELPLIYRGVKKRGTREALGRRAAPSRARKAHEPPALADVRRSAAESRDSPCSRRAPADNPRGRTDRQPRLTLRQGGHEDTPRAQRRGAHDNPHHPRQRDRRRGNARCQDIGRQDNRRPTEQQSIKTQQ